MTCSDVLFSPVLKHGNVSNVKSDKGEVTTIWGPVDGVGRTDHFFLVVPLGNTVVHTFLCCLKGILDSEQVMFFQAPATVVGNLVCGSKLISPNAVVDILLVGYPYELGSSFLIR